MKAIIGGKNDHLSVVVYIRFDIVRPVENKFKELIEPVIKKVQKKPGKTTKVSHYKFFYRVLYVLRTGISWRDLPSEYGNWHTIYTRYKRWSENGFFWH